MSKDYMDKKIDKALDTIKLELKWGKHYRDGFGRLEKEVERLNDKLNKVREIVNQCRPKFKNDYMVDGMLFDMHQTLKEEDDEYGSIY